jgi:hypothetical protein
MVRGRGCGGDRDARRQLGCSKSPRQSDVGIEKRLRRVPSLYADARGASGSSPNPNERVVDLSEADRVSRRARTYAGSPPRRPRPSRLCVDHCVVVAGAIVNTTATVASTSWTPGWTVVGVDGAPLRTGKDAVPDAATTPDRGFKLIDCTPVTA